MTTATKHITVSPVNMEDRAKIDIRPGDTVRVLQKVLEKGKTRLQPFEGIVLARKHGSEPGATFTVRRVVGGHGVEKIFPLYSPNVDKIEIVRRARMRRAKLYHIRKTVAREIKRQMRNMQFVNIATESDLEEQAAREKADAEATEAHEGKKEEEAGKEKEQNTADQKKAEGSESDNKEPSAEEPTPEEKKEDGGDENKEEA